jgi:hypothetical protein
MIVLSNRLYIKNNSLIYFKRLKYNDVSVTRVSDIDYRLSIIDYIDKCPLKKCINVANNNADTFAFI